MFSAAAIWFIIISTKFVPELLISHLEDKYAPLVNVDQITNKDSINIMILGGGYADDLSLLPNDQLNTTTLARLSEGIRLHLSIPDSKIVSGGYKGKYLFDQAVAISNTAVALGVNAYDVKTLNLTQNNTLGEAKAYFSEFGNKKQLILVTDAIHMPRAMILFRKVGLDPIPAPTNHMIKHGSVKSPFSWLPSISNIQRMEVAMHEWVGLAWVRLGGGGNRYSVIGNR